MTENKGAKMKSEIFVRITWSPSTENTFANNFIGIEWQDVNFSHACFAVTKKDPEDALEQVLNWPLLFGDFSFFISGGAGVTRILRSVRGSYNIKHNLYYVHSEHKTVVIFWGGAFFSF